MQLDAKANTAVIYSLYYTRAPEPDGIKPFDVSSHQDIDGKEEAIGNKYGEELIYDLRGFRIIMDGDAGVKTILCYEDGQLRGRARGFTGETEKRMCMRSTLDELSKAYGEPESRYGMTADLPNGGWYYRKDGLSFPFFNDFVSQFEILGPHLQPNEQGIIAVEIRK